MLKKSKNTIELVKVEINKFLSTYHELLAKYNLVEETLFCQVDLEEQVTFADLGYKEVVLEIYKTEDGLDFYYEGVEH